MKATVSVKALNPLTCCQMLQMFRTVCFSVCSRVKRTGYNESARIVFFSFFFLTNFFRRTDDVYCCSPTGNCVIQTQGGATVVTFILVFLQQLAVVQSYNNYICSYRHHPSLFPQNSDEMISWLINKLTERKSLSTNFDNWIMTCIFFKQITGTVS